MRAERTTGPAVAEEERLARVRLALTVEPGHPGIAAAVAARGACEVVDRLRGDPALLDAPEAAGDLRGRRAEEVLEQARASGVRYLVPGDTEWPGSLADLDTCEVAEPVQGCRGAPLGLWVRGPHDLRGLARSVAVVGSRSATAYGDQVAADIAAGCAGAGVPVVSGAAFGIDVAAHRGALAGGGATVAVLACGVDRVYPKAHAGLLEHLAATAAVVSESPPGAQPLRHRFLARNRLIAALTTGTVVVEAAFRSGALNTANWARQILRPVMAVPGPVTSPASQGTHELVRNQGAVLVTSAAHVLEVVSPAGERLVPLRG